jgi:hypothetical protein
MVGVAGRLRVVELAPKATLDRGVDDGQFVRCRAVLSGHGGEGIPPVAANARHMHGRAWQHRLGVRCPDRWANAKRSVTGGWVTAARTGQISSRSRHAWVGSVAGHAGLTGSACEEKK